MLCSSPDPAALPTQMYQEEGIEVKGFTGVPIFQAEGLTVKTDRARYTPLFFSKSDLDAAVGNAYTQRESDRAEATRSKSDKANQELSAAQAAVRRLVVSKIFSL